MGNISGMDDFSAQRALLAVAPCLSKNFVCMELNANLQAGERAKALKRFQSTNFKRVAVVAVGEPTDDYKQRIQKMVLAAKVKAAEAEKQKAEEDKKWKEEQESWRKRKAPEEKKEEDTGKDGEAGAEKDGEAKDAETKDEEKKEEEKEVEK